MDKTTEEKIDYIYNHIKTERRFIYGKRIFKILIYLFLIAYLIYFYMYGFEKLTNRIIETIKPSINSEKLLEGLRGNSEDILEKIKKTDLLKKILIEQKEANLNIY